MFTGIIEETGTIKAVRKGASSGKITISAEKVLGGTRIGDSINTSGVCLTVTEVTVDSFTVDVMPETMNRSAFSEFRAGTKVNLERALILSGRIGGHLVSGHVDGTGKILRVWKDENASWYRIEASTDILKYIIDKGSVAIDGISLTVVNPTVKTFDVSVIPHTLAETTMIMKKAGNLVNIECDQIGKYVEKLISVKNGRLNLNFLAEQGFI